MAEKKISDERHRELTGELENLPDQKMIGLFDALEHITQRARGVGVSRLCVMQVMLAHLANELHDLNVTREEFEAMAGGVAEEVWSAPNSAQRAELRQFRRGVN